MSDTLNVISTNPAPLKLAHLARHFIAFSILFSWIEAFRAFLEFFIDFPFLQKLFLLLFASQIHMPRYFALETKVVFASMALKLCGIL